MLTPAWTAALRGWLPRRVAFLAPGLAVALAAQAACAPVVVGIGGALSIAALPANVLALPAVAITTVLGVAAAVLSPWLPGPASWLCAVARLPCTWLLTVARTAARAPLGDLEVPTGVAGALCAAVVVGAVAWAVRRPAGRRVLVLTAGIAALARLSGVH